MKLPRDPMGTAEARAMLDELPAIYFTVLRTAQIEQFGTDIRCSFELPLVGKCTKTGPTVRDAMRAVLVELSEILTRTPTQDWPDAWRKLAANSGSQGMTHRNAERFQSKARQFTVGVTMPVKLKTSLEAIATKQHTTFAEVARHLVSIGFEDFDDRSFSEAPKRLLSSFEAQVSKWQPSDAKQVMVRLDPRLAVRLRGSAKEHSRSASELGAMCLAHGFVLSTQIAEVERKVVAVRGSAIRKFESQVGLGTPVELLSGVLGGTVRAPRKMVKRLGEIFGTPEFALKAFFKHCSENHAVPAFKAENGKPQVFRSATSWEEAVKRLNLPSEKTRELLKLDE